MTQTTTYNTTNGADKMTKHKFSSAESEYICIATVNQATKSNPLPHVLHHNNIRLLEEAQSRMTPDSVEWIRAERTIENLRDQG